MIISTSAAGLVLFEHLAHVGISFTPADEATFKAAIAAFPNSKDALIIYATAVLACFSEFHATGIG